MSADSDSALGTAAVAVGSVVWNLFQKGRTATAVPAWTFDAVEELIVLELITPGLANGFPKFSTKVGGKSVDVRCWDSVHW